MAQLSASLRREAGARSASLRDELESAELRCAELQQRLERAQSRDGGLPREDPSVPESTREYPGLPESTREYPRVPESTREYPR